MKINKILNVVLVIVMSITSMLFGNRISKEERKGIEDEFKTKYGKHCTITWNEKTGTVSSIYGVKINIDSNDSSLNLAKLFIGDNNKLFGINDVDNDLKISKKIISKKRGNHLRV